MNTTLNLNLAASRMGITAQRNCSEALMRLMDEAPVSGTEVGHTASLHKAADDYEDQKVMNRNWRARMFFIFVVFILAGVLLSIYNYTMMERAEWKEYVFLSFCIYAIACVLALGAISLGFQYEGDLRQKVNWDALAQYGKIEELFNQLFAPIRVGESPTAAQLKNLIETAARETAGLIKTQDITNRRSSEWQRFTKLSELVARLELCGAEKSGIDWYMGTEEVDVFYDRLAEQLRRNLLQVV